MGVRKRRADAGTYLRHFTGAQRAPKGRRWTKPSVIITMLETALLKDIKADASTVAAIQGFRDYAATFLNRLHHKGRGRNGAQPIPKPADRGNVYLEYALSQFTKGRILNEADLIVATQNGKVRRWYDSLTPRRQGDSKSATVMQAGNPKRLRAQIDAIKAKSKGSKVDPAKAIGDAIREQAAKDRARAAEFAAQYKAEAALVEQFKAMLKGA